MRKLSGGGWTLFDLALTHQPERKTERRDFIPERDVFVMGMGYFSTYIGMRSQGNIIH